MSHRSCVICKQDEAIRKEVEAAIEGTSGTSVRSLILNHPEWPFTPTAASNHKKNCMGLERREKTVYQPIEMTQEKSKEALLMVGELRKPEDTSKTIVVHETWVPGDIRDRARDTIIRLLDKLEVQIEYRPTAAYYQVALGYCQALLAESEKKGGSPTDFQKSYMEDVKAKLDSMGKREITRTVTMKETIRENEGGNAEPTGPEITILSPSDSL